MISASKLRALREVLERDGKVVFKNGSKVERVVDEIVIDWQTQETEEAVYFLVTRPAGGIARYNDDDEDKGLRNAYEMALDGPAPKQQPSGDPAMFGDDPPF